MKNLSTFCFWFGLVSIPLSIGFWFFAPTLGPAAYDSIADEALRLSLKAAHSERWGIFVGLWPATLLILSRILKNRDI
jgi:hypothetical protein